MPAGFSSGFIAIAGRPNVGKSTFLNAVLQTKISIATDKPQTTRDRILGIYNDESSQIIFMDLPGIHASQKGFNQYLVQTALAGVGDADVVLVMVDPLDTLEHLSPITTTLRESGTRAVLVLNKLDLMSADVAFRRIEELSGAYDFVGCLGLSAQTGEGISELMAFLKGLLPEGPKYFPDDIYTDVSVRFLCQELIREKVFVLTHKEIPYACAVQVERFEEGDPVRIAAVIHVERPSQKGIIIGRGGMMLREIGRQARLDMQRLLGSKVFVRVSRDWTKNPRLMRELGYK